MDIDLGFISALLRAGKDGFFQAKKAGVNSKMLRGGAIIESWDFIGEHVSQHGDMPSEEFFVGKSGLTLVDTEEGIDVFVKEFRKRALWNILREAHDKSSEFLEERNPEEALGVLYEAVRESRLSNLSGSNMESLLGLGGDVVEYYNKIKAGERGILTPWPEMNETTLGFWPGDFVLFVARTKVGKTWCLLLLARKAWMDGKKVLFVGTEMSRLKLAIRFYCIHYQLPYEDYRQGNLSEENEAKLIAGAEELWKETGIQIVGDDFNPEMSAIEAAVEEQEPDLLLIDGIYLVQNKGRDVYERVSQTANDAKMLAKRKGIPVVVSHQLNREAGQKSPRDISLENIAMSEFLIFNSDYIIAMIALEEERQDRIMKWRWLAAREGGGKPFTTAWDFEKMNFKQLDDYGDEESFGDDDYNSSPEPDEFEDAGAEDEDFLF